MNRVSSEIIRYRAGVELAGIGYNMNHHYQAPTKLPGNGHPQHSNRHQSRHSKCGCVGHWCLLRSPEYWTARDTTQQPRWDGQRLSQANGEAVELVKKL